MSHKILFFFSLFFPAREKTIFLDETRFGKACCLDVSLTIFTDTEDDAGHAEKKDSTEVVQVFCMLKFCIQCIVSPNWLVTVAQ